MLPIAAGGVAHYVPVDETIPKQSAFAAYKRVRVSCLQITQIQERSCNFGTLCVVAMEPV